MPRVWRGGITRIDTKNIHKLYKESKTGEIGNEENKTKHRTRSAIRAAHDESASDALSAVEGTIKQPDYLSGKLG